MNRDRLIACGALLIALGIADRTLWYFAPVQLSTVGHRDSANARYYGWGFDPGEQIRLREPDTGEVFASPANNHGWRDLDRSYQHADGTFRILALGDSNTFGVLVPAEDTWTRVLEQRLTAEGWRAEVLNIGYPQWGTDQELEALRREGVRYGPDLVILQFTINDLTDNTDGLRADPTRKPFYFEIDAADNLVRHQSPTFQPTVHRDPLHLLAAHSEILKRAYIAGNNIALQFRPKYVTLQPSIEQLRVVLQLANDDRLLVELSRHIGEGLSPNGLDALIEMSGHSAEREVILRILENQYFKPFWMPVQYDPPPPDLQHDDWRLLLRLLEEMQATARSIDADMAILSDQDEGLYDWERYWFRLGPGSDIKRRFLEPTAVLSSFAAAHGIGFIVNQEKHVRARNDSHPNCEGTRAMAANAYSYVVARYHDRLEATRQ